MNPGQIRIQQIAKALKACGYQPVGTGNPRHILYAQLMIAANQLAYIFQIPVRTVMRNIYKRGNAVLQRINKGSSKYLEAAKNGIDREAGGLICPWCGQLEPPDAPHAVPEPKPPPRPHLPLPWERAQAKLAAGEQPTPYEARALKRHKELGHHGSY